MLKILKLKLSSVGKSTRSWCLPSMQEERRVLVLWGCSTKSVRSGIFPGWRKQLGFYIPAHDCDGAMQYRSAGWDTSPSYGWIWLQHVLTERCESRMGDIAGLSRTFTSGRVSVLPLALSRCHEDSSPSETWVQAPAAGPPLRTDTSKKQKCLLWQGWGFGVIPAAKLTNTLYSRANPGSTMKL